MLAVTSILFFPNFSERIPENILAKRRPKAFRDKVEPTTSRLTSKLSEIMGIRGPTMEPPTPSMNNCIKSNVNVFFPDIKFNRCQFIFNLFLNYYYKSGYKSNYKSALVSLGRFELPTPGLGILCSVHLSYRDNCNYNNRGVKYNEKYYQSRLFLSKALMSG
jgi:hypothetical protein